MLNAVLLHIELELAMATKMSCTNCNRHFNPDRHVPGDLCPTCRDGFLEVYEQELPELPAEDPEK